MTKRVVVVTGASSGIGAAAAVALAERGDHVVVTGRNPDRTRAVAEAVGGDHALVDFERFDDVRALAATLLERYERIDVLVNNAGGMHAERQLTPDGHERTLQTNLLSPFLLTHLLTARLAESDGRVVSTSSVANLWGSIRLDDMEFAKRPWRGGWQAYGTSKLAIILWMRELARRTSLEAYSVHPGMVASNFGSNVPFIRFGRRVLLGHLGVSNELGAAPIVMVASPGDLDVPNGAYFSRFKPEGRMARQARSPELAAALWEYCETVVGVAAASRTS